MNYNEIVRDFAERTRQNLEYIEQSKQNGSDVYEVTQLVNSLLGLLVFPQQRYFNQIPETPIEQLQKDGWPTIVVIGDFQPHQNLKELMRYLRNAIAHFNVEFIADNEKQLQGIKVWNKRGSQITWKAEISLNELRMIVEKFTELILQES